VPRQEYSRELKIAALREIDSPIQRQQLSVQSQRLPVEGIPQFLIRHLQPSIAQSSVPCRIRFPSCDGAQNPWATGLLGDR
jgi:hypothetical protein